MTKPPSRGTVFLGFAEALSAPEAAWSLVECGYEVVAFARKGRHSALRHSRFVTIREIQAPELDYAESREQLALEAEAIATRCTPGTMALLPLDDASLFLASGLASTSPAWKLAGPEGQCAATALNKEMQVERALEAGFPVPRCLAIHSSSDAYRLLPELGFPVILKTSDCAPVRDGRIQKGRHWICANMQEFESALSQWRETGTLLLQQYFEGAGEGVFGIATPSGFGAWSAHRRLRMMNPHGSGSSACMSQPVSSDAKASAERMLSGLGWQGLFMVEMLRDRDGKLWFIELNGRPWGSMALSRRQGLEYPAWQVRLGLGEDPLGVSIPAMPPVICRHVGRELMHLLFVIRGRKSKAIQSWPGFWRSAMDMLKVGRQDRLYNWCPRDPMVFLSDCYYTLHDNLAKTGRAA